MPWATEQDVVTLTGVAVEGPVLAQAQGVVEMFAGVSESNDTELSGANERMLRAAVAYQAAWMHHQIDVATRTDVSQLDQDGMSFTPAGADALVLAPLARRALERVSWLRKRSLRTVNPNRRRWGSLDEYSDAWLRDGTGDCWRPL